MAQEAIVVSLKHSTGPWTVIHALDVKDLVEHAHDLFPNEIGPIRQKAKREGVDPDPIYVIAVSQDAYTNKLDAAISHFAKNVVKERLGGREIDDEDPETDNRPRRRSRDEDEPREERRSRRDDDDPPARQSRSYGDDADEPDNAPRCDHGKMVRREGTSAKGPWGGWFCPLPRERKDEQCSPEFDKKKGGYRR